MYFKAIPDNGKVYFEWKTASEENNSGFIIKKKNNSGIYEPLTINNEEVFFNANPSGGVYTAMYAACIYDGSPCEYDDDGEYIKTRFFDENVTNGTNLLVQNRAN